jgi:hypothetical protein
VVVRQFYFYDLDQKMTTFLMGKLDIQNMLRAFWIVVGKERHHFRVSARKKTGAGTEG